MQLNAFELDIEEILKKTDGNAPGPAFARHTAVYENSFTLVSSDLLKNQVLSVVSARKGAVMFLSKDISTLKKALSHSETKVAGLGSFALVTGTYGGGHFTKSAYTKKTSKANFIDDKVIDYRHERYKERGAYVFVLSTDKSKHKVFFSGDADVKYMNCKGNLPLSQIAFALNGFKSVFTYGSPFKKLSWRERMDEKRSREEMHQDLI